MRFELLRTADPGGEGRRGLLGAGGGDVIHFQDGNARDDVPVKFTVTMLCAPGTPMLTFVEQDELDRLGWSR